MSISKANLLDLVESIGCQLAAYASPNYYRYEDQSTAKQYDLPLQKCRKAWARINEGHDPQQVLTWLALYVRGTELNIIRLIENGLLGKFNLNRAALPALEKSGWYVIDGDLYFISVGDKLNQPCISRLANSRLPKDKQKREAATQLATQLSNPCTRHNAKVQVE